MTLMAAAAGAVHLDAGHEELCVGARLDHFGIDRLPEAGPAGAAVELAAGGEQRPGTAGTGEQAVAVLI